jgi:hydrogenase maturation protein HypF
MLPTTPLHGLLLNLVKRPLVCTSGNLDGEPLVFAADLAIEKLGGIADRWLEHDRPIRRPIDDSVVRVIAGRAVTLRLGRGYAPLSLKLDSDDVRVAVGGHQKTSLAISNGAQALLGPHVGDMETVAARRRFIEQATDLSNLYGVESRQLVCDQHPEYFTTEWATQQTDERQTTVVKVQHHHAHVAAGMLEHNWLDREVLGVAFDGTGYGTDGTIWGGEILLATATGFLRVGHLRSFALAGGEFAVRQPWRVAVALVQDAVGEKEAARLGFNTGDVAKLLSILPKSTLSPLTTSVGRLFDGIAAIVLGVEQCQFEGQAAMLLEAACDESASGSYDLTIMNSLPKQLDWRPLVEQVLIDRNARVAVGTMALRFHRGLSNAIVEFCSGYSALPVVLGGGVFQNRILVELLAEGFAKTNQTVGLPGLIPTNDGGLAAGQLVVAAALMKQWRTNLCV